MIFRVECLKAPAGNLSEFAEPFAADVDRALSHLEEGWLPLLLS
jgi:hypothetical protein